MDTEHDILAAQQQLYATSAQKVRSRDLEEPAAREFYAKYLHFVSAAVAPNCKMLDVGCGIGWSSYLLADRGFDVTGVDLNPDAFEAPSHPKLLLHRGSAMELPFPDESFDAVGCLQTLEHVPDPGLALNEMLRVLRPSGVVCIVGPNLLSILGGLRNGLIHSWRNRPVRTIFIRTPGMARHPHGNTVPENFLAVLVAMARTTKKLLSSGAHFTMRRPDLNPPFHADNDSCYLCNPIDMVKYFRNRQCRVLLNGYPGRPPLTWLLAEGTFVAARKAAPEKP